LRLRFPAVEHFETTDKKGNNDMNQFSNQVLAFALVSLLNAMPTHCAASVDVVGTYEQIAPVLRILSPAAGAALSGTIQVTYQATAPAGRSLSSVTVSIDTANVPQSPLPSADPPLVFTTLTKDLDARLYANGSHVLIVTATDSFGSRGEARIPIQIVNSTSSPQFVQPLPGSTVHGVVPVTLFVPEAIQLTRVTLMAADQVVGECTAPPYTFQFDTTVLNNSRSLDLAALLETPRGEVARVALRSPLRLANTPEECLVGRLYVEILGRHIDAGDLRARVITLLRGQTPVQFASVLANSREGEANAVSKFYGFFLHRTPDAGGLARFTDNILAGDTQEQAKAQIIGSPEYFRTRAASDNRHFVTVVYRDVLGRNPDAQGRLSFETQLSQGVSRTTVALKILTSREGRMAFVNSVYLRFLHRFAEPAGLERFVSALASGARAEAIVAAVAGSLEYQQQNTGAEPADPVPPTW
jgi:hypothetical protein